MSETLSDLIAEHRPGAIDSATLRYWHSLAVEIEATNRAQGGRIKTLNSRLADRSQVVRNLRHDLEQASQVVSIGVTRSVGAVPLVTHEELLEMAREQKANR